MAIHQHVAAAGDSPADAPVATTDGDARTFVQHDGTGSTSAEIARLLVARGLKPLPESAGGNAVASAAVYLASPRETIPWAQLADGPPTLVNKYRGHALFTRKSKLARLLRGYERHPQTFVITPSALHAPLPEGSVSRVQADKRRALAAADAQERSELLSAHAAAAGAEGCCWIVKDAQGAKGDNIALCASAGAALDEVESGRHSTAVVVQQYVRAPYLLPGEPGRPGRKFDIRVWVVLDPAFRAYAHRLGVCRTSSRPYEPDALADTLAHVTNHCVQEAAAEGFGRFEPGNELFFDGFDALLAACCGSGSSALSVGADVWPQVRGIVSHVAAAAAETLRAPDQAARGVRSFQLFGFDFLLDADARVHLLEVNGSPAIADKLRAAIVGDLVRILLDGEQASMPATDAPVQAVAEPRALAVGGFELVYDGTADETVEVA